MGYIENITVENSSLTISSSSSSLIIIALWPIRIACPILILLCPIANLLCIRVFQSKEYEKSSSKYYFIWIAIFDTIYVMVTAPLIFLITFEIYILNKGIILCKLIVFLNYLSCQISAGLLACLSIDRLLATSFFSLYRYNCSPHISFIVCIVVIIIMSVVNSHYLIGYNIDIKGFCVPEPLWYRTIYYRLKVVYLLSYSIIPFSIITVCNLFISIGVCKTKAKFRRKYSKILSHKTLSCEHPLTKAPVTATHISSMFDQVFIPSPIHTDKDSETKHFLSFKRYSSRAMKIDNHTRPHEINVLMKRKKEFVNKTTDTNDDWELSALTSNKLILNDIEQSQKSATISVDDNSIRSTIDIDHSKSFSSKQLSSQLPSLPVSLPSSPTLSSAICYRSSLESRGSATHFKAPLNAQSSTSSAKMCMQLQITISLLAISISFIFCTLPNCISTIMIESNTNDNRTREFWQAMNYFSLVPLLITHSVNFIFYYLSSHMFRDRFKKLYIE